MSKTTMSLKESVCIRDLTDKAILINEVSNTALNHCVPGCSSLAISELKRQAVEVIIPKGQMLEENKIQISHNLNL